MSLSILQSNSSDRFRESSLQTAPLSASLQAFPGRSAGRMDVFGGSRLAQAQKLNAEPKYAGRYLTKPDINRFVGKGHQPPTVEQTGNGQSTGGKRLSYLVGNDRPRVINSPI